MLGVTAPCLLLRQVVRACWPFGVKTSALPLATGMLCHPQILEVPSAESCHPSAPLGILPVTQSHSSGGGPHLMADGWWLRCKGPAIVAPFETTGKGYSVPTLSMPSTGTVSLRHGSAFPSARSCFLPPPTGALRKLPGRALSAHLLPSSTCSRC